MGRFNGGFFALRFWGAYTWRGLFSEFYGIFLLFEMLLYLESFNVLFLDRLLEYIHGVLCCFLGYKKICFYLLLVPSRDCHLKPLAFSQGNWEGLCSSWETGYYTYMHLSSRQFLLELVVISKMYFLFFFKQLVNHSFLHLVYQV